MTEEQFNLLIKKIEESRDYLEKKIYTCYVTIIVVMIVIGILSI